MFIQLGVVSWSACLQQLYNELQQTNEQARKEEVVVMKKTLSWAQTGEESDGESADKVMGENKRHNSVTIKRASKLLWYPAWSVRKKKRLHRTSLWQPYQQWYSNILMQTFMGLVLDNFFLIYFQHQSTSYVDGCFCHRLARIRCKCTDNTAVRLKSICCCCGRHPLVNLKIGIECV